MKNKLIIATVASAMLGVGCSKSSKSSDGGAAAASSSIDISGSLSAAGSSGATTFSMSKIGGSNLATKSQNSAFAVTDYKVACATFEDTPKACGAAVEASGAFALKCDGYKGLPFGCFVFNTSTFKNYPIVFNVAAEGKSDDSVLTSSTGITANISLDLETGVASAEVERVAGDTATDVAIDVANLALMNGTYSMTGVPWATASVFLTDDQKQGYVGMKYWNETTHTEGVTTTAEEGYNKSIEKMGGGSVYFQASTDGTKLSAWPSAASYATCGSQDSGFSWKISDGVTPQPLAFTGADSAALMTSLSTGFDAAISSWLPVLANIGGSGSATVTATCKYAIDLPFDFWNNTPTQIAACQADTTNCYSSNNQSGDPMNALMQYKFQKLYSGYVGTDAILGAVDYSASTVADSNSLVYGYMSGWDNATGKPTYTDLTDINASNIATYKVDLGGCIQWSNDGTPPKIIKPGDWVTRYMPGNTTQKEKCTWSESRYLKPDTAGNFVFNGTNYREIQSYIAVSSVNKQVWNKVCSVVVNTNPAMYQMVPSDMSTSSIQTDFSNRMNGGNANDLKGRKYAIIYQLISGNDHGGGGGDQTFHYCDRFSNSCGQVSCSEIKDPSSASSTAAATWAKVTKVFGNSFDEYQLAQAVSCVLVGSADGKYSVVGGPALNTAYLDANSNGQPDIVDTLTANSCLPKFQVTRTCAKGGTCDMKVVCNDLSKANGGCDAADPAPRMALLDVTAFGGGKYQFGNYEERYQVYYDPTTSTSKSCTMGSLMKITNRTALTSGAAGTVLQLQFDQMESEVCEGETSSPDVRPPSFFDFTKQ